MAVEADEEIKPFYGTYKITSFSMSVGMIYPNPATDKWRLIAIPTVIGSMAPIIYMVICDMFRLWKEGNINEVLRHVAVMLPFIGGFIKMVIMYVRRGAAKQILDIIDRDYSSYNHATSADKAIVLNSIRNSKAYLSSWHTCVFTVFFVFTGSTSIMNIFSSLFMAEPKRYMIYDINIPDKDPEMRFETPYFEIVYIYTIYVTVIYVINYTGYDSMMIVSINHACLRVAIFVRSVEEAMKLTGEELRAQMDLCIKDQIEIMKLIGLIQSTFNIYLGCMYGFVLVEMVICIYLMNEGYHFDFQFICVTWGTVLHIYVPCMIADKLKCKCEYSAVQLYCCGWENMYELRVRRCLPFMIARAQSPVYLKALGILTYEMDLFVRTSKTAYSMYTLLKTQQN